MIRGIDADRRIIVALDFDTQAAAEAIVERLGDAGQAYKIGLELLTSAGPAPSWPTAARPSMTGRRIRWRPLAPEQHTSSSADH